MVKNRFSGIIGQPRAVSVLGFYLDGYKRANFIKPLLITGSRGIGKTTIARKVGEQLKKKFIEINGASLKNLDRFVDDVIVPHVDGFQATTIFIDEIHAISPRIAEWLLSVLAYSEYRSRATHAGQIFEFDFRKLSFLAGTTNAEKLSKPFTNRLKRIELEPYDETQLIQILKLNAPEVQFAENIEHDIISASRGFPRETVSLSQDITEYCKQKGKSKFAPVDWGVLKVTLGINPLGLTTNEIQLLKILHEKEQTLRSLAAYLTLDPTTVQRDCESYLLARKLIAIDGKRHITYHGRKLIDNMKG